ncbi:MAG: hypothetical protein CML29_14345 [Rhizobiales bacterium]|nr:hypothetical protein [Hyphomicrobiales bacterium]MBA69222.1 hypothetical protein [Hyphomicrobiales bacterium]|tara:strand:+ start:1585 stop:3645 length:2061 start_codon:yes stop_codon:yes gene_type:complete
MSATKRTVFIDAAAILFGVYTAWTVFFGPLFLGPNDFPGDPGDARFNVFILEHVWRWLSGEEVSLTSPGIFYPYPFTLAFSETHAGTAWAYALFRLGGLDPYGAFKAWFLLGYMLTFLASYHVARKFKLAPFLACASAFAFSFSLPSLIQMGHAQLLWRPAVPYAFYYAWCYGVDARAKDAYKFLIAIAIQTLINVYLGLFAFALCAILFLVAQLSLTGFSPIALFKDIRKRAVGLVRLDRNSAAWATAAVVIVLLLFVVLGFQAYAASIYGLGRSYGDMVDKIPQPASYLIMDRLRYWAGISGMIQGVPVRNEQQIFIGVPLFVWLIIGLVVVFSSQSEAAQKTLKILAVSIVVAIIIFTGERGVSPYWLLAKLPGFDAMRAIARYVIILIFPISIFVALFIQDVVAAQKVWLRNLLTLFFVIWVAADAALLDRISYPASSARASVEKMRSEFPKNMNKNSVLLVGDVPGTNPTVRVLDVMLAGQSQGIRTLNGYSGNTPPGGKKVFKTCGEATRMLKEYDNWAREHDRTPLTDISMSIVALGLDCEDLTTQEVRKVQITRGPAPSREQGRLIYLSNLRISDENPHIINVKINNNSASYIHALSSHPLRLSWRDSSDKGWNNRYDVAVDIGPEDSTIVQWVLPANINLHKLQVTFVIEGMYWAHDIGIAPIRYSEHSSPAETVGP